MLQRTNASGGEQRTLPQWLVRDLKILIATIWVLTVFLLLQIKKTPLEIGVVFPYTPILRSTTTVDDYHPASVVPTQRNQVFVQASVLPQRTVVVAPNGKIQEIWSNTAGNVYYYALYVRRGSLNGPLMVYSPSVHEQYATLISLVDWHPSGRVYPAPEKPSAPDFADASARRIVRSFPTPEGSVLNIP